MDKKDTENENKIDEMLETSEIKMKSKKRQIRMKNIKKLSPYPRKQKKNQQMIAKS